MAHWMVNNLSQVPQWEAEISQGRPKKLYSGMPGKSSMRRCTLKFITKLPEDITEKKSVCRKVPTQQHMLEKCFGFLGKLIIGRMHTGGTPHLKVCVVKGYYGKVLHAAGLCAQEELTKMTNLR